jgi:hypothetical protein
MIEGEDGDGAVAVPPHLSVREDLLLHPLSVRELRAACFGRPASSIGAVALVAGVAACRDWHDPIPFEECQPYALECADCSFEQDLATGDTGLLRVWRCVLDDGTELDAVRRRVVSLPADDTHFYDASTGERRAAVREHDDPVPVCGEERSEEWWGEILPACDPVCEHDPDLEDADEALGGCDTER